MTERYVINDEMIEDTSSDDYYHFNDWRDFEGLCKLANSLYEDNKPLQDEIQRISKDFKKEVNEIIKAYNTLRRENEELKQENQQLKELLHESLSSLIWEWSSEIDKDLKELNKVMNTGDIDEITKFVRNE